MQLPFQQMNLIGRQKLTKDFGKTEGLPQYISNFSYFLYFSSVADKGLRG